ncbi:chemotaxis protein CheD [Bacillus horti]|uniref:Probable chemoreceptor glutamine deamidase CheD n=1 Tax=Caldalkalibacillus horti TaxID=77523 RepID=A0ABT9VV32_9BACI|nr:chemotaxis protein CheD [Bacillus horti]MDQ0164687.1 chemotaxis protein CheD [Bacillus horti]
MSQVATVVTVGIADVNIAQNPNKIRTAGLGSCVGVCLYDPVVKLAGLAHIMLPSSDIAKKGDTNFAKYADTAIPKLLEMMEQHGGKKARYIAKIAGGAQMFVFQVNSDTLRIGPRNVEACKRILNQFHIPIHVEDTGGNCGRTIEIDTDTGLLKIRTVNQGTKEV